MVKDGIVAFTCDRKRMNILEIQEYTQRPTVSDLRAVENYWKGKGKDVFVMRASDELLQYKSWSKLSDRTKMALGRIEIAISRENWDEAHAALNYAERGVGEWSPIDTTCADLHMNNRQLNALEREGIQYVWQLLYKERRQLLAIPAIGPDSVDDIIDKVQHFLEGLKSTGEAETFLLDARERNRVRLGDDKRTSTS